MSEKKLLFGGGCVALLVLVVPSALFLYNMSRFESWLDDRLEAFAGYSHEDWQAIYDGCAELAASAQDGERTVFEFKGPGWASLPQALRDTEPRVLWVTPEQVTLRFSGGHARFVHIEYFAYRNPAELELLAEGFFDGVIYPSDDRRPIGERVAGKSK